MGGIFLLVCIIAIILLATALTKANKKVDILEMSLDDEIIARGKVATEKSRIQKSRDVYKSKYEKLLKNQSVTAEEVKAAPVKPKRKYTRKKKPTTPKKE